MSTLQHRVSESISRYPDRPAVAAHDGTLTYAQLDADVNKLGRALLSLGVGPGDRVGLWLDKSCKAVVAMQAVLRIGGAYVPLDPQSPPRRIEGIARDCALKAMVTTEGRARSMSGERPPCIGVEDSRLGLTWSDVEGLSPAPLPVAARNQNDLAYILYTSGSTGVPKGVCLSQRNAISFVDWAVQVLGATQTDRFANHAPFFFDLSVLDIYAALFSGGCVCLVPDALAFAPKQLVSYLETERISVWYSVPSALIMMMQGGGLLDHTGSFPRVILFAGEPFPIRHLRALVRRFPQSRYLNLYGPTETNVCTAYELRSPIPDERLDPLPIGKPTCGDEVSLAPAELAADGSVERGRELLVTGPTVMLGYWGHPRLVEGAAYRTGDLVEQDADGNYVYLGRRDQMLKVRGRRIEAGDIEAALLEHPLVRAVAVLVRGAGVDARLVAFIVVAGESRPNLIELKQHCSERLPRYMIVDEVREVQELPLTRNGKVDRRALLATLTDAGRT